MDNIKKYLSEQLEYEPYEVELTIADIEKAGKECIEKVKEYIAGKDVSNYAYRDYSVKSLMDSKRFNAIAAILAISCLKRDYDYYSTLYRRPMK